MCCVFVIENVWITRSNKIVAFAFFEPMTIVCIVQFTCNISYHRVENINAWRLPSYLEFHSRAVKAVSCECLKVSQLLSNFWNILMWAILYRIVEKKEVRVLISKWTFYDLFSSISLLFFMYLVIYCALSEDVHSHVTIRIFSSGVFPTL